MMNSTINRRLGAERVGLVYGVCALIPITHAEDSYSPYVTQNHPTHVYFGDTHLHTNLSFDAYNFGTRKLGPEEAYRFAKGEILTAFLSLSVYVSTLPPPFVCICVCHLKKKGKSL